MSFIFELPEIIFYELQRYLSHEEFRNTLNSCKHHFLHEVKEKYCCYYLNPSYSSLFLQSNDLGEFRSRILSLIEDPVKQLGIHLEVHHQLNPNTLNNAEIIIQRRPLSDFQLFSSVKLLGAEQLVKLNPNDLNDLSILQSVQYLRISHCKLIYKLHGLSLIRELTVNNFDDLFDISPLSDCQFLTRAKFSFCRKLSNINSLWRVSFITVESCPISDAGISELGRFLKRLHLLDVSDITSINHLHSLEYACLEDCLRVISVNGLPFLKTLSILGGDEFISYSDLPSLKKLDVGHCPKFKWNDSNSSTLRNLQFCSDYSFRSDAIPSSCDFLSFISWKTSFQSLEILQLQILKPRKLCLLLDVLAEIGSLRKLYIQNIYDPNFHIHLFQQIVWLSINSLDEFLGIVKPMPNLRTLDCFECLQLKTLAGLKGNKNMKLRIGKCRSFRVDFSFYEILSETVDSLIFHQQFDPIVLMLSQKEQQQFEDFQLTNDQLAFLSNEQKTLKRDKIVEIQLRIPFPNPLFPYFFQNLHCLILHTLSKSVINLSSFAEAGIHKIPILSITCSDGLQSLYPQQFIPEHQHLYIEHCDNLASLGPRASLQCISLVSISDCPNLKDFTALHGCKRIQFNDGRAPVFHPSMEEGFIEIMDRIEPFRPLKELKVIENFFEFSYHHQIHF